MIGVLTTPSRADGIDNTSASDGATGKWTAPDGTMVDAPPTAGLRPTGEVCNSAAMRSAQHRGR